MHMLGSLEMSMVLLHSLPSGEKTQNADSHLIAEYLCHIPFLRRPKLLLLADAESCPSGCQTSYRWLNLGWL